jgi:hypothetical protein
MKERMEVALRVLASTLNGTKPTSADIELLQHWIAPGERFADPDELACMVINEEIQSRKNPRIMQGAAG